MRIRQLQHSVYQVEYHVVWGTLYRRKFLKHYVRKHVIECFYWIQKDHPDWYFVEVNTGEDHVHLLMEIPPKYSVAEVIQKLKAQSSFQLRKRFRFIREIYDGKDGIWSTGYFVSTVGLNEDRIRKYIERQNIFDQGWDVTGEFDMPAKETPHGA